MTTTPAILGAWSVLPNTSEKRNIIQCAMALSDHSVVADADFEEQYAVLSSSSASGPAMHEPINIDDLTLVDGDILYVVCRTKVTAWAHASAGPQPLVIFEETRHTFTGYSKSLWLGAEDTDTSLHVRIGDGTNVVATGNVMTYTLGTVYTLMISVERVSSTSATVKLWKWDGTNWVEQGSATGTLTWSSFGSFKSIAVGSPMTFAKGDNGTIKFSRVIPSINVIPAGSMLCDHEVLVTTPDGSTYDEWVDAAAGATVNDDVDDVLGSESSADYMTSTSTTAQKTQELNVVDVSGITDTIRGIIVTAGVTTTPATCNGTAYLATRLSGTDSAFLDAYYGDSGWDATSNAENKDTSRFFEKDPSGTAWTQANVNSATIVARKVATGAAEEWAIHSLVLQVLHGDVWTPPAGGADRRRLLAQVIG